MLSWSVAGGACSTRPTRWCVSGHTTVQRPHDRHGCAVGRHPHDHTARWVQDGIAATLSRHGFCTHALFVKTMWLNFGSLKSTQSWIIVANFTLTSAFWRFSNERILILALSLCACCPCLSLIWTEFSLSLVLIQSVTLCYRRDIGVKGSCITAQCPWMSGADRKDPRRLPEYCHSSRCWLWLVSVLNIVFTRCRISR